MSPRASSTCLRCHVQASVQALKGRSQVCPTSTVAARTHDGLDMGVCKGEGAGRCLPLWCVLCSR